MTTEPTDFASLLAACEKEPIHIPGAIQPFGILLTVEPRHFVIRNASENCASFWGMSAVALVGRSFADFLSLQELTRLRRYLDEPSNDEKSPLSIALSIGTNKADSVWKVRAHRHRDTLYMEMEPDTAGDHGEGSGLADFHTQVRDAVSTLQGAGSVHELCDRATQRMSAITGFDRVMVYRFDEDWHGVVVSETCGPGTDSYLGHHFPASDIPAQARAIFLQNWLRMIPDVDYVPSRVYPGVHEDGASLDLGKALLRSVSPIHLEYLRNMGVKATLTISLVNEGKLWGLIACHHAAPRLLDTNTRIAAELIGRLVSSQLRAKEALEDLQYKGELEQLVAKLLGRLEQVPDLAESLRVHATELLDLCAASAVAIRYGGEWTQIGKGPSPAELQKLIDWLALTYPHRTVFDTDRLSHCFPDGAAYREVGSGLVAASLAKAEGNWILWFRPEVSATVTWAGAPEKSVRLIDETHGLHPRKSFESWKEMVIGTAMPWKGIEVAALENLRNGILALALEQEHRKEQAARRKAERLSREKDEMVMMVSHDLKTPLNVVAMSLEFVRQFHPSSEPSVQRMVERGARATHMMTNLITNTLDMAKIEAGTLDLELKDEDPVALVSDIVDMVSPLAEEKDIQLTVVLPEQPPRRVQCEKIRIVQVLNNLLSNALKFTPSGGRITVLLREEDDEVIFSVKDTGEGMSAETLAKIFDRFWQAEDTRRHGTGLGLWIARSIVSLHQGRIWVASEIGKGSVFHFSLKTRLAANGVREETSNGPDG